MKTNNKLTLFLLVLYLVGMIGSAYFLFNIKSSFIYDLHILEISDSSTANKFLFQVYIVVGITMLIGLLTIYFLQKSESTNVIYVEKSKEEIQEEEHKAEQEATKNDKIKKEDLDSFINAKDPFQTKNLNAMLSEVCNKLEASQGAIYLNDTSAERRTVVLASSFAMVLPESKVVSFEYGEGLVGQVAKENRSLLVTEVPVGYLNIVSGLGKAEPSNLLIVPIASETKTIGVVEIASFGPIAENDRKALEESMKRLGEKAKVKEDKSEVELAGVAAEPVATSKKTKKKKTEDK